MGRSIIRRIATLATLLSVVVLGSILLNSGAVSAAPSGTCTFDPAANATTCTIGSSLSGTSPASSDGTYWLFNLSLSPAVAPPSITVCWKAGKFCEPSVAEVSKGSGNATQYLVDENISNTDGAGNPLVPFSAIATIKDDWTVSNFVLGGIPGETFCSDATSEEATEIPTSDGTDVNGSCVAAVPPPPPTTTAALVTAAAPTTTAAPVIVAVAQASSAPPTTSAPVVTTAKVVAAIAPPPTTTAPTTTTAPPATVPVAAPETVSPAVAPPFIVSTVQGPPGSKVVVEGGKYGPTCSSVIVSFNGSRLLEAPITRGGPLAPHSLYIPGDTTPGQYQLSVSCANSVNAPEHAVVFSVTSQSLHRSGFATSLLLPSQINYSLKSMAGSLAVAGISIPFVAFPSGFLNAALESHEVEIGIWMAWLRRKFFKRERESKERAKWHSHEILAGMLVVTAALNGFLDPHFGIDLTSLALFVGLLGALALIALITDLPAYLYLRRESPETKLSAHALPGALVVAFVCVLLSRSFHFEPGFLYGTVAGIRLANKKGISVSLSGRASALSAVTIMVFSLLAWLAREPLLAYAAARHATFLAIAAEAMLAAIFMAGIQGVLLNMLPLTFLPGRLVFLWNKKVWFAIILAATFAFVHLLLGSGSGYVGRTFTLMPALLFEVTIAVITSAAWIFFMRYDATHGRSGVDEVEEVSFPI